MSESMRMTVEIMFNIAYLIAIYAIVILMIRNMDRVAPADQPVAKCIMWAFLLLALGDTGHVGFRVIAYAMGGLETQPVLFGMPISLVGLGTLATAITVTFFYVFMLDAWRVRYDRRYGWFEYILLAAAALRLIIMVFPANEWGKVVPPQPWSLIRNAPLTVLGLGVAYLILRDARATNDRIFFWIGISILISYACYLPVILFVQRAPMVGMLMIPKTLAYVAIAIITYRGLYTEPSKAAQGPLVSA